MLQKLNGKNSFIILDTKLKKLIQMRLLHSLNKAMMAPPAFSSVQTDENIEVCRFFVQCFCANWVFPSCARTCKNQ